MKYPSNTTHIMMPLDLFKVMLAEAEVGYHGFEWDADLANRVSFVIKDETNE